MIASVTIRNFRALRNTSLTLQPFNLVIGPNGSGKTSLIHALLRLRTLAKLPLGEPLSETSREAIVDGPEIFWSFAPPHDGLEAVMKCVSDSACDFLDVAPLPSGQGQKDWPGLRSSLMGIRVYVFDHHALGARSPVREGAELKSDGANLATVLASLQKNAPEAFASMRTELCRILPEYDDIQWKLVDGGSVELALRLAPETPGEPANPREREGLLIPAEHLSQGTLYLLAMLALAYDPKPPSIVCLEEIDRGFHPRLLREVRDVLYRLSYPQSYGLTRAPVQVIATTHSPYLLDLFSEHPDEVVLAEKQGNSAHFSRLSDRSDLAELLSEGGLGDMWYAGILGGVPQESLTPEQLG